MPPLANKNHQRCDMRDWLQHITHLAGGLRYYHKCVICQLDGADSNVSDGAVSHPVLIENAWYRQARASGRTAIPLEEPV